MKKIVLISFFFLSACGIDGQDIIDTINGNQGTTTDPGATTDTNNTTPPILNDPTLVPYLNSFYSTGIAYGKTVNLTDVAVAFGTVSAANVLGSCAPHGTQMVVTVNAVKWATSPLWKRNLVLFHELGHCVLSRAHLTNLDDNGIPTSLMYPIALTEAEYEANYSNYMHELFHVTIPGQTWN